jgi:MtN3 and saliva related transmembrane protein
MNLASIVGVLADMCTIVAFWPQVWKVVKTKNTESISIIFLIILTTGSLMWVMYGVRIDKKIIFIANSSTLAMSSIMLIYKVKNLLNGQDKI